MSNSTRCAACKSLRRRCPPDCVLAPYFPSSNPERFACVHKIFGSSNVSKLLQRLPVHLRAEAADCMSIEAKHRVEDPVYGCVRIISQLQQEINTAQRELAIVQGEIAFAQQAQQQQQHHERLQIIRTQVQHGEPSSWVNENQQGLFQEEQRECIDRSLVLTGEPSWFSAVKSEDDLLPLVQQPLLDFSQLRDHQM